MILGGKKELENSVLGLVNEASVGGGGSEAKPLGI